jgi:hypothetical protein
MIQSLSQLINRAVFVQLVFHSIHHPAYRPLLPCGHDIKPYIIVNQPSYSYCPEG